jgi:Tfp pilus assembly protein PilF
LAKVELAFQKIEEDSLEAESIIKKALELSESQFIGSPYQNLVKILAYVGLGRIYQYRMIYELAEEYFTIALSLRPPQFYEAIVLLNRGRVRLDNEDFVGAYHDLRKAQNEPFVASNAYTNMGILHFKQGLFDQAESELIKAWCII